MEMPESSGAYEQRRRVQKPEDVTAAIRAAAATLLLLGVVGLP